MPSRVPFREQNGKTPRQGRGIWPRWLSISRKFETPPAGVGEKRIFRKKPRQGWWISHLAVSGPAVGFTPSRFTSSNTPRHKVGGFTRSGPEAGQNRPQEADSEHFWAHGQKLARIGPRRLILSLRPRTWPDVVILVGFIK